VAWRNDRAHFRSDWDLEHGPYTFEGEIEGLSRFAQGVARAKRRGGRRARAVRVLSWILVLGIAGPFAVGLVAAVVRALAD
jgi:hypothetical protein